MTEKRVDTMDTFSVNDVLTSEAQVINGKNDVDINGLTSTGTISFAALSISVKADNIL